MEHQHRPPDDDADEDPDDGQPGLQCRVGPLSDTFAVGEEDGTIGLSMSPPAAEREPLTTDGPSDALASVPAAGHSRQAARTALSAYGTPPPTGRPPASTTASATSSQVDSVVFSTAGQTLAVGLGIDVGLWNTTTDRQNATLTRTSTINGMAFRSGGGSLAGQRRKRHRRPVEHRPDSGPPP